MCVLLTVKDIVTANQINPSVIFFINHSFAWSKKMSENNGKCFPSLVLRCSEKMCAAACPALNIKQIKLALADKQCCI